jgi:hypothetical protein
MATKKLSFFFEIEATSQYIGTPVSLRTKNDLDAHGVLLDLKRLPDEVGVDYYKRLRAVVPLRAGAHQEGMVHGITRELGLEEQTALKITPVPSGTAYLAPSPRVDVLPTKIILYSEYWADDTYVVDVEVDIFDHGEGYLLTDLVDALQTSEYFDVELGSSMTGQEKSMGLIPGSSSVLVLDEITPVANQFYLDRDNLVPDSISFQDTDTYDTEVSPAVATNPSTGMTLSFAITTPVAAEGQYFVDYEQGFVISYQTPPAQSSCRYIYRDFPWRARWSPLGVYSLRDTYYRDKVFEDEIMQDGSTREGLVTAEGKNVYDIIFTKSPSLWGR